jgi:hypothetical protein
MSDVSAILNLGNVKDLASVSVNGQSVAVLWHAPFKLDVSEYIRVGANSVSIAVTNTWANRMLGDKRYPDDCEWGAELRADKNSSAGSSLASIPEWLLKGQKRPSSKRVTFSTWDYFTGEEPLIESGLLSGIKLEFLKHVLLK